MIRTPCLVVIVSLACFACSDESPGSSPTEPECNAERPCPTGQSCIRGTCQDRAEPDTGDQDVPQAQDTGDDTSTANCTSEVCDGVDNDCDELIDEEVHNECGGCQELSGSVGDPCGECGGGTLDCDGINSLTCTGATAPNACGGCNDLGADLGGECGECGGGAWACSGDSTLVCNGAATNNACGGCAPLAESPGAPCGTCGTLACASDGESLTCQGDEINACGGCTQLEGNLGDLCGTCGTRVCGPENESLVCDDPGETGSCPVTRFIAMGDTGEGNTAQYRVAAGAQVRCDAAGGCDGFIMLGDNIYDEGAQSPSDEQFDTKIDAPYANLRAGPPPTTGNPDDRPRMPIYVSLGNHDLGGAGLNSAQVAYYLEYAASRDWFYYPDEYWDAEVGNVHLISLHTNPLAYGLGSFDVQGALVESALETRTAPWTIVFGHHPYRSNGRHGNAGAYEGIPGDLGVLGGDFRRWVDEYVCNQVDFFISGHDHNRQWLNSVPDIPSWPPWTPDEDRVPCRTHFAVSGAGAKTTDIEDRDNDMAFASEELGFLFMEFHTDHVNVEFCDADGNTEWSRTIVR